MRSADRHASPGAELLHLARGSIEYGIEHLAPLPVDCESLPGPLAAPAATFTTLHCEGKLRGCCGRLEAARPLATDVAHSAFQAAFRDPRFDPVVADELATIRLEVAVLSPMEEMSIASETDLLDQLVPGRDGLVIVDGVRRATFLPKVWDQLPEPRRFLEQLKLKAGLPQDYWSERLAFQRYRTTSYAEPL